MHLLALGLNHTTAPVEVREQLVFSESEQAEALQLLVDQHELPEAALLSTCNRTEIYAVGKGPESLEAIRKFLTTSRNIDTHKLQSHLYELTDSEAAVHLFRVACGIDSLVIGESQILGQVRRTLEIAQGCGSASVLINELFQRALKVGKQARTDTDIGRGRLSVSTAAVELAGQIFDSLEGRSAMLVGAGEMIELTAQYLVDGGIQDFVVANRTFERAADLARRFQGEAVEFEHIEDHIAAVDIIISSTASADFVIQPAMMQRAMSRRRGRPLFLIDIAVPRDVDPAVRQFDNVFLFDIDDLQKVVESNKGEREAEIRSVQLLVDEEQSRFQSWLKALGSGPLIQALNQQAENLQSLELERWRSKLAHLSAEDRETVEALLRGYSNKLLHQPLVRIRELSSGADGYAQLDTIRRIFNLGDDE